MATEVEYILSLKDLLTGKIKDAQNETDKLEGKMNGLSKVAKVVGGVMAGIWAVSEISAYVNESSEAYSKVEFAQSQLEAGLASTRGAAGVTFDDLSKSAEGFAHSLKFTKDEVMGMQSIFLTFPDVKKDVFDRASQAAMDMATRMGTDAKGAALQLGKALQDPEKGIAALRRVGVNTDELKKKFETVTDTVERQKLILAELETEFGGSALAAAEADVAFRKQKTIEETKLKLGELVDKIEEAVMPALSAMADFVGGVVSALTNLWDWAGRNKDLLMGVAAVVAGGAAAFGLYTLVINASAIATSVITGVTWLWNAAQLALNASMTANPIGIVIVAIGALVAGVIYAWNTFDKFRATIIGVWGVIKQFASSVVEIFEGVWMVIQGVFTMDPAKVISGWDKATAAMSDVGKKMATAYKDGYEGVMAESKKKSEEEEKKKKEKPGMEPGKVAASTAKTEAAVKPGTSKAGKSEAGKVTGSKSVTISINIGKMIEKFQITTTNMQESSVKVRELVAQTLLSAVNDSQVIAGI